MSRDIHGNVWGESTRAKIDFEACNLVFVYGTLKKNHGNNTLLNGASLIGETVLEGDYVLRSFGAPTLIHHSEVSDEDISTLGPVRGEVWAIKDADQLENLDSLEGHPWGYYRSICRTEFGTAWVYFYPDSHHYSPEENCPIVEGAYQWK